MEKTTKSTAALTLDLKDPVYAVLVGYAGGISKLLSAAGGRNDPNLAGSLDDFLGAVYSLIQAKQHGFQDRTSPIELAAVEKRAKRIAKGALRTDGKWVAGFYFNNGLFRTAAVYHRVLKIIIGTEEHVPALRKKAKSRFSGWQHGKLDLVHSQVNDLKHTPRGVHDQRTVTYADAVTAAGQLLDLIQASAMAATPEAKP